MKKDREKLEWEGEKVGRKRERERERERVREVKVDTYLEKSKAMMNLPMVVLRE